jgi:DNA repair protein RecO (recombination protein O)
MSSAIFLSSTKYSDTGSIVHLYTAEYGRMQYMVYGNKYKALLSPLSIIEFNANKRHNAPTQIGTLSSVSLLYTPQRITTDVQRQCVAMFVAEILLNTLRHPLSDTALFDWLCSVIRCLDQDEDVRNLHLEFLMEYTTYLGIGIDEEEHPEWQTCPSSRTERQKRLMQLCTYYAEYIEDFRMPKSLEVLMEVFD